MAKQTEKQIDRIEAKLDKMQDHLSSMDSTLAAQNVSLEEHIKRTNLLEASIQSTQNSIKPLQSHVDMIKGVGKFIGLLAAAGASLELLKWFFT